MIALLLAAQLAGPLQALPRSSAVDPAPPAAASGPFRGWRPLAVQGKDCPGAGRMETSAAEPTALYRQGDRPAKGLRKWADFPEGNLCRASD